MGETDIGERDGIELNESRWQKIGWFVGLWCAGVLTVAAVGLLIKYWLS